MSDNTQTEPVLDEYSRALVAHLSQVEAERHYRELLAYLHRFKNSANA